MKVTVPCHYTERKSYGHLQSRVGANIAKIKLFDLFTASQSSAAVQFLFVQSRKDLLLIEYCYILTLNSSLNYIQAVHKGPLLLTVEQITMNK